MSFPKNMWLPDGSGSLANEDIFLDSLPRTDLKRVNPWLMDSSEHTLLFKKKQAIEFVNGASGAVMMNTPLWCEALSSHYDTQTNIYGMIKHSDVLDTDNKCLQNQFSSGFPVHFPMLQSREENPSFLSTGFGKTKPDELSISGNFSLPRFFCTGEELTSSAYQCSAGNIPAKPFYSSPDFVDPLDHGSGNRFGSFVLPNPYYCEAEKDALSVLQASNNGSSNSNTLVEKYEDFISLVAPSDNYFSVDPYYSKINEAFVSDKGSKESALRDLNNSMLVSVGSSNLTDFDKALESTVPFGGFGCELEDTKYSDKLSNCPSRRLLRWENAANSVTDVVQMNKDLRSKKGSSSSNFPTNVKSLLSTGILDGVPVKYVSWSREKNLRGVIKGTGYLCSCKECKISKVVNAYEFECHAGCKTKHPNNHIYFENGKTIYAVVQELKNTPTEKLFEALRNSAGSPINQKNLEAWKSSFQAGKP